MAANVAASATMNIQMPSLREGTPNGDGSCAAVSSATDRQQGKQIEPEDGHEVPIERGRLERRRRKRPSGQPAPYVHQSAEAAQHVQGVQNREHIEERAARAARQEQLLRAK